MEAVAPVESGEFETPPKKTFWFLLSLILIFAAWFRVYELGLRSFWLDEFWCAFDSRQSLGYIFNKSLGNLHPFYTFLVKASCTILGESEFSARLPAAIFSILSIGALALFLRSLGHSTAGLCSALFLATLPVHIEYARNARGYPLLIFMAIVSTWALLSAVQNSGRAKWLVYGILGALTIYAHLLSGLCVVFSHLVAVAGVLVFPMFSGFDNQGRKRVLVGAAWAMGSGGILTALLFFPWVTARFGSYTKRHTVPDLAAGLDHIHFHLQTWLGDTPEVVLFALFFLVWGSITVARKLPFLITGFLVSCLVVALACASAFEIVRDHQARYLLFLVVAVAFTLGVGLESFGRSAARFLPSANKTIQAFAGVGLPICLAGFLSWHSMGSARNTMLFATAEDWKGISRLIQTFDPGHSFTFMPGQTGFDECLTYYGLPRDEVAVLSKEDIAANQARIQKAIDEDKTVWLVSRTSMTLTDPGYSPLAGKALEVVLSPFVGIKVFCKPRKQDTEEADRSFRIRLAYTAKGTTSILDPVKDISIGIVEYRLGDPKASESALIEARETLESCLNREIYTPEKKRFRHWLAQADTWLFRLHRNKTKDLESARLYAESWMENAPDAPQPYRELAFLALDTGRPESALGYFEAAANRYDIAGNTPEVKFMKSQIEKLRGTDSGDRMDSTP